MNTPDPYLIFRPRPLLRDLPKNLLPYAETVRRASEWEALNFPVKLDEYGFPFRETSSTYSFSSVRESDPLIAEAIRTGKKAVCHPLHVFDYILEGCDLSDFVELPEDVKAYCQGNLLRINGSLDDALPLFEKAVRLNPDEVRYWEAYYPLRLSLGDISSIEGEFACFERDMDSVIHTGRFEEWMKALIAVGQYQYAKEIVARVDTAISRLADGTTTARYYGQQKPDWYAYKREQFIKKAENFLSQIQKLEAKAASTSKPKSKGSRTHSKNSVTTESALRGSNVSELLYSFTQRCFIGEAATESLDLSAEGYVYERLASGPLSLLDVHQLPSRYRRVVHEILTQYIMFLEMNRDLPFPPDFLDDSSNEQLGIPLLLYINEHRWPFPQLLSPKQ
jgi:tetratricopeptide (TPR) repeat protein